MSRTILVRIIGIGQYVLVIPGLFHAFLGVAVALDCSLGDALNIVQAIQEYWYAVTAYIIISCFTVPILIAAINSVVITSGRIKVRPNVRVAMRYQYVSFLVLLLMWFYGYVVLANAIYILD
jgi:hypothetical protein